MRSKIEFNFHQLVTMPTICSLWPSPHLSYTQRRLDLASIPPRKCTDILFTALFSVFLIGMCAVCECKAEHASTCMQLRVDNHAGNPTPTSRTVATRMRHQHLHHHRIASRTATTTTPDLDRFICRRQRHGSACLLALVGGAVTQSHLSVHAARNVDSKCVPTQSC